jgi:hypothetical protein
VPAGTPTAARPPARITPNWSTGPAGTTAELFAPNQENAHRIRDKRRGAHAVNWAFSCYLLPGAGARFACMDGRQAAMPRVLISVLIVTLTASSPAMVCLARCYGESPVEPAQRCHDTHGSPDMARIADSDLCGVGVSTALFVPERPRQSTPGLSSHDGSVEVAYRFMGHEAPLPAAGLLSRHTHVPIIQSPLRI